jgi:hypothetical protein
MAKEILMKFLYWGVLYLAVHISFGQNQIKTRDVA